MQIPKFNPATANPARIQTRIGYLQQQRPGSAKIPRLQNRLQMANKAQAPGVAPAEPSAPAAPTPAPAQPAPSAPPPVDTMFPNERMFEPKNYEGSPLYQFQVGEGQKQLSRSLAARGLTNSGHGIEQELNIPLRAAAQDTDRMTRVAESNADRLANYQQNEALRLERAGNNQWDRSYSLAQLLAEQSPWQAALSGLNNTADITKMSGDARARYLQDAYKRVMASRGGGGGGFVPMPLPTGGPDYSGIMPTQISGNQSSNNGWLNVVSNLLGGLF